MKKIKSIIFILFLTILGTSCDTDKFLSEIPKDFLSPGNSYTSMEAIESAVNDIYLYIRHEAYNRDDELNRWVFLGQDLDVAWTGVGENAYLIAMNWETLNGDNHFVVWWWNFLYNLIFRANTIMNRGEMDIVKWDSEKHKNALLSEARFIRGWSYRMLANMYGGVPIILEETSIAKFDYVRASREAVYQQSKKDLEFATQWLNTIDQVKGGKAPRAAAYHALAEVNIALGDYPAAIAAASKVINDPNFYLMTERFGVRKDFMFNGYDYQGPLEPWGDVYWDLFQEGNMNWKEGNSESIWNIQFDYDKPGGGGDLAYGSFFSIERWWHAFSWGARDLDGVQNVIKDTLMGRPVGVIHATDYAKDEIWNYKDDFNRDIRNSKYNIQRNFYFNNPESKFYGQPITADNIDDPGNLLRTTWVSWKKCVTTVHHGRVTEASGQKHDDGYIYKDWYLIRLPETYLLRAEAYYLSGDYAKAAADINVIRNRAQATPVTAGDVDLDLILDERARELYMEEYRVSTLCRMGKLVDRLNKYNRRIIKEGLNIPGHINLLPIPNRDIEANKDAVLEQNPGYQ